MRINITALHPAALCHRQQLKLSPFFYFTFNIPSAVIQLLHSQRYPDHLCPPLHCLSHSSTCVLLQKVTLNYTYLSLLNERIRVAKHTKPDNIMRQSSGICGLYVTA